MDRPLAIDIETTGLCYRDRILSLGAAWREGEEVKSKSWLLGAQDLYHDPVNIIGVTQELRTLVQQASHVILHNATFDLSYLLGNCLLLESDIVGKLFDTLVTARMTGPREHLGLDSLCEEYQINDGSWVAQKSKRKNIKAMGIENLLAYNEKDALYTLLLGEKLWAEGKSIYGEDFLLRESDFCRVMAKVRVRGKKLNRRATEELLETLSLRRRTLLREVLWPRKIESAQDRTNILKYLHENNFHSFEATEKGNEKLDRDALEFIIPKTSGGVRQVVEAVLELRKSEKLIGTYLEPLLNEHSDMNDRIHSNYTVGGTVTYRLSSSHPNAQNMPRGLDIWQPYLAADYSQAELRLAAAYAVQNNMAEVFLSGKDIHLETAIAMWGAKVGPERRSIAKYVNFGTLYGGGAAALVNASGIEFDQAMKFILDHRKIYPRIYKTSKEAEKVWREVGFLRLLSGKRIYATLEDKQRMYKGFNNIIQGGVGVIVQQAMTRLDALGMPIIEQIHDEIGFDIDPNNPTQVEEIEGVMNDILPEWLSKRTKPPVQMYVKVEGKGTA